MTYDVIPINKKHLLKKIELAASKIEEMGFAFQEAEKALTEYFKVLQSATDCLHDLKNEVITVENYQPIGNINGEDLFVCDEKFVTCRIVPKNEIKDKK